eukprot:8748575-Pyramimonas_sp.AAC.1
MDGKGVDLGRLIHTKATLFSLHPHLITNKPGSNFVAPFWAVQKAAPGQKPNMKLSTKRIIISVSTKDGPLEQNLVLDIPVYENTVVVNSGDELLLPEEKKDELPNKKARRA